MKNNIQNIIIKNMVCPRCVAALEKVFYTLGLPVLAINLGSVTTSGKLSTTQIQLLKIKLADLGFELLDDKQTQLINLIKSTIIQEIHYQEEPAPIENSSLLSQKLHYDYAYLSRLFSSVEDPKMTKRFRINSSELIHNQAEF